MAYDPSEGSLIQAIMQGSPADAILTAKDIDDWIAKLDIDDYDEATDLGLTLDKCIADTTPLKDAIGPIRTRGQLMAQDAMRIAKARMAIKAKRSKMYADVVSGIMAMALKHRQDRGDGNDDRTPR